MALYFVPGIVVSDKLTVSQQVKAESDVRTTIVQGLVGVGLLIGLYFTAVTYRLNREGQVTERFTRAIEQLGSDSLEIRLGGIYGLERIAHESKRDHWPIMEVLTAFVREHAPLPERRDAPETLSKPATDVKAVLMVLARRNLAHETNDRALDLSQADLSEVRLDSAPLRRAKLSLARFFEASLQRADLRECDLTGAFLNSVRLDGARLDKADLRAADLTAAILEGASLREASLRDAKLRLANLTSGDLSRADLLTRANLAGAKKLDDADFAGANLQGIRLAGATDWAPEQLRRGNLDDAEIEEAFNRS